MRAVEELRQKPHHSTLHALQSVWWGFAYLNRVSCWWERRQKRNRSRSFQAAVSLSLFTYFAILLCNIRGSSSIFE